MLIQSGWWKPKNEDIYCTFRRQLGITEPKESKRKKVILSNLSYEEYSSAENRSTPTYKMSDKQLIKNSIQANGGKGLMVHENREKGHSSQLNSSNLVYR